MWIDYEMLLNMSCDNIILRLMLLSFYQITFMLFGHCLKQMQIFQLVGVILNIRVKFQHLDNIKKKRLFGNADFGSIKFEMVAKGAPTAIEILLIISNTFIIIPCIMD
jgi:hypothetical protein